MHEGKRVSLSLYEVRRKREEGRKKGKRVPRTNKSMRLEE